MKDWEMQRGIPAQDIIWYNVSQLLLKNKCQKFKAFAIPFASSVTIMVAFLTVERICAIKVPYLAPFVFQITTTGLSFLIVYYTPWFVYNSLIKEPHWLKSSRDRLYTNRLFALLYINAVLIPLLFNMVYCYLFLLPEEALIQPVDCLIVPLQLSQGFYLRLSL